ncbi:UvrD-helicase domain-containing protein [Glycomyces artemisiae]|uniref:AAA domain-containing protein n=1 Tax=Glycomyces artemisiae TaxID=1076443 RepID=A0A2T0URE8_9ACTN|nr:UvrD-helicase domain-containing protein [Glycomyces artemisiae]PRY60476.1 AAA domain-containing protein [Glycomyces artemisiae]
MASPLFELSADMRTTGERRRRSHRPHSRYVRESVPMPEPALTTRTPDPWLESAPLLTGMDEVGAGLLDSLDAMQRVAASAGRGPLLINASPGTGKTHLLIRRTAYLVQELGVPARQCLVLAASTAGAARIRRELRTLLGREAAAITVAEFDDFTAASPPELGHLFIDDLPRMPMRLFRQLTEHRGPEADVTATGDPDSALCAGEPAAFAAFGEQFPQAHVMRLSRNHRSPAAVLVAASQVVEPISRVPGRLVQPERPALEGSGIGRYFAVDADDEKRFVEALTERLADLGVAEGELAVIGPDGLSVAEAADGEYRVVCLTGVTAEDWPNTAAARRELYVALGRTRDLAYVSHTGAGSPLLADVDQGLFSPFGMVPQLRSGPEQPRLL